MPISYAEVAKIRRAQKNAEQRTVVVSVLIFLSLSLVLAYFANRAIDNRVVNQPVVQESSSLN